jgi:hypothetical protein
MGKYTRFTPEQKDSLYRDIITDMTQMGNMELQAMRIFQQRILTGQKAFGVLTPNKKNWKEEMFEELVDSSVYGTVELLRILNGEDRPIPGSTNGTGKGGKVVAPAKRARKTASSPQATKAVSLDWSKWPINKTYQALKARAVAKYGEEKVAAWGPKRCAFLLSGGTFGRMHKNGDPRVSPGTNGHSAAPATQTKPNGTASSSTGHKHVIKRKGKRTPGQTIVTDPEALLKGASNGVDAGSRTDKTGQQNKVATR